MTSLGIDGPHGRPERASALFLGIGRGYEGKPSLIVTHDPDLAFEVVWKQPGVFRDRPKEDHIGRVGARVTRRVISPDG